MRQCVWKYELRIEDNQTIAIPARSELLAVQMQYGTPTLWARVEPEARLVNRKIRISGTGHDSAEGHYIGTVQLAEGRLVFHVFDQGEDEAG